MVYLIESGMDKLLGLALILCVSVLSILIVLIMDTIGVYDIFNLAIE